MSYKIETIALFDKQLKRLLKKYPSLTSDIKELITLLQTDPKQGTPLGNNCYKIRLAIQSKSKGKSGGARVIYYLRVSTSLVVLFSIYDKSEQEDISDKGLKDILSNYL